MRWLPLLALALLVSCAGPERTTRGVPDGVNDSGAPQGASSIVVQTSTSPSAVFKQAARVVQQNSYGIKSSDVTLHVGTTTWKTISSGLGPQVSTQLSLGVVGESPTRLRITGTLKSPGFSTSSIQKTGQSGSVSRKAWAEMLSIAYHVSEEVSGTIRYKR